MLAPSPFLLSASRPDLGLLALFLSVPASLPRIGPYCPTALVFCYCPHVSCSLSCLSPPCPQAAASEREKELWQFALRLQRDPVLQDGATPPAEEGYEWLLGTVLLYNDAIHVCRQSASQQHLKYAQRCKMRHCNIYRPLPPAQP